MSIDADLSDLQSATVARTKSGGGTKDRKRALKKMVRRKALIVRTVPILGTIASFLMTVGSVLDRNPTMIFKNAAFTVVYIGLYFWARRQPVAAVWTFAVATFAFYVVSVVMNPMLNLGLIPLAALAVFLGIHIKAAHDQRHAQRQLDAYTGDVVATASTPAADTVEVDVADEAVDDTAPAPPPLPDRSGADADEASEDSARRPEE